MKLLKTYIFIIAVCSWAWLKADADEMIIVTNEKYLPFAEELAQMHRDFQKMDVTVMSKDDFLGSMLRENVILSDNGTSFLLFYGDGTLPQGEIDADGERFLSDQFWGTDVPDELVKYKGNGIVTGRIPCRRAEDAASYNDKVRRYFTEVYARLSCGDCLLIADEDSRHEHQLISEELAGAVENVPFAHVNKVYLDHYDNTVNRAGYALDAVGDALNSGIALMMYAGHGTVNDITTPLMLDNYRTRSLRNRAAPVMFFNACEVGRLSFSEQVITQNMLFNEHGGGIAVIAPSKKTMAGYNQRLALNLVEEWKNGRSGATWGELWVNARNAVLEGASAAINEALTVNTVSYNYLGDPAIPVYYPCDSAAGIQLDGEMVEPEGKIDVTADRNHRITLPGEGIAVMKVYGAPKTVAGVECDDNRHVEAMAKSDGGQFVFDLNLPASFGAYGQLEICAVDGNKIVRSNYDVSVRENTGEREPAALPAITDFAVRCDARAQWSVYAVVSGNVPSVVRITVDGRSVMSRVGMTEDGGMVHYAIGKLGAGQHSVAMSAGSVEVSETVDVESPSCLLELVTGSETARGTLDVTLAGDASGFDEGRLLVVSLSGTTVYSRRLTPADGGMIEWNLCDASGAPVRNGPYEMYFIYSYLDRYGCRYYGVTEKVPLVVLH